MTSTQVPDTDYDENHSANPSEEEDLEEDSSSDFTLTSTDLDEEELLDEPLSTRRHDVGQTSPLRNLEQQPAWWNSDWEKRAQAHGTWDVKFLKFKLRDARRYRRMCRQARWEDRRRVRQDERESFEDASFGDHYPSLSQLKIPAARRYAIMAARKTRSREKEMSQRDVASCKEVSDHQSDLSAQGNITTACPAGPHLSLLPLEIQTLILKYCLTTETPFIDFCFGYRIAASEISADEPRGQDSVSLAVLATNRQFRAVGLKILWQENNFLFTRSDEFTLLNTDILMSRPQITLLRHMILHQDSIWPTHMFYDRVMLDTVLFAVSVTELFPVLENLHIEMRIGQIYPYMYERGKWLRATLLEARYFLQDIRKGRQLRALQRLSIAGVSDDDLGCLAIKLASYLVVPKGMIGVKLADLKGSRSSSHGFIIVPRDSDIIWMKAHDVAMWLQQRRELHHDQPRVINWGDFFPNEVRQME